MDKKNYVLLIGLWMVLFTSVKGQNLNIPQDEFSVSTIDSMATERGSFSKLNVWILRSKAFAGASVTMGISSSLPEGVQVNFQSKHGKFDLSEATISVNPRAKAGTYFIIVSGTMRYKTKGTVVKVNVIDPIDQPLTGMTSLQSNQ